MVNFNDKAKFLLDAFKIGRTDLEILNEISDDLDGTKRTIPWVVRRIWIDERLTDNAKCFGVFMLGRWYETIQ